jgi:hypothetical protein
VTFKPSYPLAQLLLFSEFFYEQQHLNALTSCAGAPCSRSCGCVFEISASPPQVATARTPKDFLLRMIKNTGGYHF